MGQGKTNRNAPKRAASSEAKFSLMEFKREFPDDATCLDLLVAKFYPDGIRCPKCERVTKHHRLTNRPAYSCQFCGRHEYPLKGTIFEGSSTSLELWFYAMYLMASTRCGISAKQLEREIGVSYPTAWRMFKQIRSLLGQDTGWIGGPNKVVEVDEAFIGGKAKWASRGLPATAGRKVPAKTMVLGMAERGDTTAKISAKVIGGEPFGLTPTVQDHVRQRVLPSTAVFTDEAVRYWPLRRHGYFHERVNHSAHVYVSGNVHTNTVEGFWSLVKRGISGVYHGVSAKHLQTYLDEYVFRYNNREATGRGMFDAFLSRIEKRPSSS